MPIEITPALLADMRKKAEAATPGPWVVEQTGEYACDFEIVAPDLDGDFVARATKGDTDFFLAANPAVVMAMVAEIERLRDKLDSLICPDCDQQPKFCVCECELKGGAE